MARPLRIEYAGALYHITARGNTRADIYFNDVDRLNFLDLLAQTCEQFDCLCHAYCLMGNHYHLLLEKSQANLAKAMRFLNGVYTQRINHRYQRVGHLFQGRYKSTLVQSDSYLLELARYIVLNPVRAGMVHTAEQWPWSSYRATAAICEPAPGLTTDCILSQFAASRTKAAAKYCAFVAAGKNLPSPFTQLKNQIFLGDDQFIESARCHVALNEALVDIPKPQKLAPPKPLAYFKAHYEERNDALAQAYLSGHYSLEVVGAHFGVSRATVARAVKKERQNVKCPT